MEPNQEPVLWIVCEVYYPEMISTGYYLTTIAEGLARDRPVKVICGQPNYANRGTTAPQHEVRNGVEIFRVGSTRLNKNRIINRIVNMTTIGATMMWACLRQLDRGDSVLVVTAPPSLPYMVALAAMVKGAGYTPLIHDVYPEQLVAIGSMAETSIPTKLLNFFNRWLYKHAARIIVVGRDMKELLLRKTAGLDIPIINIANWADLELVEPAAKQGNPLIKKLRLQDKFILLFAGNFGRPTDIGTIVEAAELLRNDEKIHFLFVGDGAKRPWLEAEIKRRALTNITVAGSMPREEQSIFLNACDVGLVTLVRGMWGAAVPSRTYNFLAAGKPILALVDEGSEVDRVVAEEHLGWNVGTRDPAVLAQLVRDLAQHPERVWEIGTRAREVALSHYSSEQAVNAYRDTLC